MVETPATALASSLVDANAVDDQLHARTRPLATMGKADPKCLSPDDVQALCATLLNLFDGAKKQNRFSPVRQVGSPVREL